jgi:hypothetical protein
VRRPGSGRRHLQSPLTASQERRKSRFSGSFRRELPLFAGGRTDIYPSVESATEPREQSQPCVPFSRLFKSFWTCTCIC